MDSADGGQRVPATPQAGGGPGRVTWLPAALRRGLFRQLVRRPGASNQLLDAVLGLDVDRVSRQLAVQLAAGRRADWGEEYVWQEPGETGHPSTSYQDLVTLFDHLALPAGSRFVDLGCGFGRAGFVAALLCQDVCFVGYELVAERVAAAQRAAARLGLRQLVFETADLSRVQPVDADVYYVFCSFREDTGRRVLGLLQAVAQRRPIQLVVNTAMYGFEPEATPWLRLVAQVGIFSHYASVAVHAAAD
ncbi:MAG TPA: methyltransferase domain-containing protein [Aquabacterium sp.]|nr:methyltransferase domain-containing protein [Aquabacterium sp.]HQC95449.1 methyltransferase domain-containing protein [Aquabacterium sp.]